MMLSLAGIPLTAGFISKFFAVLATVRAGSWLLAAAIILGSAISLYYYLHFMLNLFKRPQNNQPHDAVNHWGFQAGGIMVILVSLSVLAFGIFPDYLIALTSYAKIQWGYGLLIAPDNDDNNKKRPNFRAFFIIKNPQWGVCW